MHVRRVRLTFRPHSTVLTNKHLLNDQTPPIRQREVCARALTPRTKAPSHMIRLLLGRLTSLSSVNRVFLRTGRPKEGMHTGVLIFDVSHTLIPHHKSGVRTNRRARSRGLLPAHRGARGGARRAEVLVGRAGGRARDVQRRRGGVQLQPMRHHQHGQSQRHPQPCRPERRLVPLYVSQRPAHLRWGRRAGVRRFRVVTPNQCMRDVKEEHTLVLVHTQSV